MKLGMAFSPAVYQLKGNKDSEERTVSVMASGYTQVFRDNEWLLPWMKKNPPNVVFNDEFHLLKTHDFIQRWQYGRMSEQGVGFYSLVKNRI